MCGDLPGEVQDGAQRLRSMGDAGAIRACAVVFHGLFKRMAKVGPPYPLRFGGYTHMRPQSFSRALVYSPTLLSRRGSLVVRIILCSLSLAPSCLRSCSRGPVGAWCDVTSWCDHSMNAAHLPRHRQVMDRIQPGVVLWKRVNINPKNRYKKVENGNYVIDIAKVSRAGCLLCIFRDGCGSSAGTLRPWSSLVVCAGK